MKKILTVLLIFINVSAFGFDWDKCKKGYFDKSTGMGHWVWGLLVSVYGTSEFIISTGDCSMVGVNTHDRKIFMAYNFDKIQVDAARGGGEYVSILGSLYECNQLDVDNFSRMMQSNYNKIFQIMDNAEKALLEIDQLVRESHSIIGSCKT